MIVIILLFVQVKIVKEIDFKVIKLTGFGKETLLLLSGGKCR